MHVLITGGCGFIGSHLVEYHINKGDKVHVVDDLSTGSISNVASFQNSPNFHFDNADILTWTGIEKAVAWADRIYHLAAVVGVYRILAEPIKVLATNIPGCERLIRAIATSGWRPRLLLASSAEVYGINPAEELKESDNLMLEPGAQSRWNYAVSKIADEAFGLSYARQLDIPITIVRLFNTIGPRQTGRYGMVVPRFIEQAVQGQPVTVYGDGTQSRCFCDVRDVVNALNMLMESPASVGEIVNIGSAREISIKALAELICQRANSASSISYIPYEQAYSQKFTDIKKRKPNLDKLSQLINYKFQWTLEDILDNLILLARKGA